MVAPHEIVSRPYLFASAEARARFAQGTTAYDQGDYATAIEHGWQLVTKDRRLLDHPHPRPLAVW